MENEKKVIQVEDKNGVMRDAEVILYFDMNGKTFIVYTLNETDENGMILLYSSMVKKENDTVHFEKVQPDDWANIKQLMGKIVKEGKE